MVQLGGLIHLAMAGFFGVHAIRSGQQVYWLFVLFAFPLMGSMVYFFAIYLPNARNTPAGMRTARKVQKLVDPTRDLRDAEAELDRTPTAYNRARLAAVLLAEGRAEEAIAHYEQAASGPYADDLSFLKGLAGAQNAAGRHGAAAATLARLFAAHPEQNQGDLALAHAEALAGAGSEQAAGAFEAVIARHATTEAQCKYGAFLLDRGDVAGARRAFEAVLRDAARGHSHSRELNREWIDRASSELRRLGA